MLRNYLKMALKVLTRRKFYTFISMFGICITLTILLVVYAFWEHSTGAQAPETKLDRSLIVNRVRILSGNGNSTSTSNLSFYFLDRYVSQLKTPEEMSFYSLYSTVSTYVNSKKVELDLKYTDAAFWEVMDFEFVEGRPYLEEEVNNKQPVVIINKAVKEQLFGKAPAIGKEVEIYKEKYRVIGVVENVSYTRLHSYASVYVPYSLSRGDLKEFTYQGPYMATLVAKSPGDREAMQKEFNAMMQQVENPEPDRIDEILIHADTYLASNTRWAFGSGEDTGLSTVYAVLGTMLFLFMLLPTINLMNINISRIMERASEIGVRKAFGATSTSLVGQFVLENIILTLLCGLLSVGFAFLILEFINSTDFIPHAKLAINLPVLGAGLFLTLIFGLFSGVYPAWRMSRLQAADTLKIS